MQTTLLITLEYPPRAGGVGMYYQRLCRALPPNRIIVVAPPDSSGAHLDIHEPYRVIRLPELALINNQYGLINQFHARRAWLSLHKTVRAIFNHYHCSIVMAGHILPLGTVALRSQLPYGIFCHGLDVLNAQQSFRKRSIAKKVALHAKLCITNSYFTKDCLINLGVPETKINVLYPTPGKPLHIGTTYEHRAFLGKIDALGKKIILSVGRLVERKGFDQVIAALPEIIRQCPDVVYILIGDGPNRQNLEQLVAKLNVQRYVRFLGYVPPEKMSAAYETCSVFAMPSRQIGPDVEGFGIVFLEANLYGKPVLGGRSGGIPEAVVDGTTGILVDPGSVASVADGLITLLANPALAERLGLQGLERATNLFRPEESAQKLASWLS